MSEGNSSIKASSSEDDGGELNGEENALVLSLEVDRRDDAVIDELGIAE